MSLASAWRSARLPTAGLHLDTAACGQTSMAVQDAVAAHLRHESELGGYVAQAAAEPMVSAARAALGTLLGFAADDVVFVESGFASVAALLRSWPLAVGARVGMLDSEWGPNLAAVLDRGFEVVRLPGDPVGHLDLARFDSLLQEAPPDLVLLTHVAGHRGLVQPAARCRRPGPRRRVCRSSSTPAQALGHVDTVTGCRRQLFDEPEVGCRSAGGRECSRCVPAVAETLNSPCAAADPRRAGRSPGPWLRRWESAEGNVAGRVGLAVALSEHLAHGPSADPRRAWRRLAVVLGWGSTEVGGWKVVEAGRRAVRDDDPDCRPWALTSSSDVRARLVASGHCHDRLGRRARAKGDECARRCASARTWASRMRN